MNVLLFTGQGSQFPGMGAELAASLPAAAAIYEAGSDILGFDLKKLCLEGDEETLGQTCNAQPAIYATELICLEALKARGIPYAGVCGHSLGEYAAMTACGMLTPENGFRALKIRAQAMDEAAKSQDSGMYAILRMAPARIAEICAQTPGYVVPVNFNSPAQTVIAGERQAVDAAAKACTEEKARAVPLAVAAAFHSKLMQPAADSIAAEFTAIPFGAPRVPFYTNLTGEPLAQGTDMAQYCAQHCVSPVRFAQELENLHAAGFDAYIELGPKKVLTSFVKQTLKDVRMYTVTDPDSLEEAATCLKHTD
ncbi:ACP S-malonyltransferase [Ruminococcus sp.]|uniref:ACP S-malonyltransferase n=1 Tax=Ruminococcus sp. TaxID=41978 RepID=UPI003F0BEAD9